MPLKATFTLCYVTLNVSQPPFPAANNHVILNSRVPDRRQDDIHKAVRVGDDDDGNDREEERNNTHGRRVPLCMAFGSIVDSRQVDRLLQLSKQEWEKVMLNYKAPTLDVGSTITKAIASRKNSKPVSTIHDASTLDHESDDLSERQGT